MRRQEIEKELNRGQYPDDIYKLGDLLHTAMVGSKQSDFLLFAGKPFAGFPRTLSELMPPSFARRREGILKE